MPNVKTKINIIELNVWFKDIKKLAMIAINERIIAPRKIDK